MKFSCFFLALFACLQQSSAQVTVAENWTQTDCNEAEHDLFATLDTGTAVVMEFIMLEGCLPCINAAHLMQPVIASYNAAYNNRVQWYTFGYNDTYDCAELLEWKTENVIDCDAQFIYGQEISNYYGGMGMPTIVVAGRTTHSVYFNQFGFVPADTADFSDAIAYALGIAEPTIGIPDQGPAEITVFPNPASDRIEIKTPFALSAWSWSIMDIVGNIVLSADGAQTTNINISDLVNGYYLFRLNAGAYSGSVSFLIHH